MGDALGAPLEFMTRPQIHREHGVVRDMIGGGWLRLRPGEVTDDTQMALILLQSLVEHQGHVSLTDIGLRFKEWAESGPKDIGRQTCTVLRGRAPLLVGSRKFWEDSGGRAAGNGGVMRCAPVALAYALKPIGEMLEALTETCRLTHWAPECVDSCLMVGMLIRQALTEEDPDFTHLLQPYKVAGYMDGAAAQPLHPVHVNGYTYNPMFHARRSLVEGCSFEESLVEVVNLGGDADTNGAVVGAVLGARYGLAAIPDRWLTPLQGLDELVSLATQLYNLVA